MEARHEVVKAGKARYTGACAIFAWQFQKALHSAEKHGVPRVHIALAVWKRIADYN